MKKYLLSDFLLMMICFSIMFFNLQMKGSSLNDEKEKFTPLSYEEADAKAETVLQQMTLDEKIAYVGGDKSFFIREIPRLNIKEVYMTDATQGVHIRQSFGDIDLSKYQLEKSTAFPCPISLAATWNPELSYNYAKSVGEECRAGGIGVLLGPGMNNYRQSQCGRNFEYFGEDPFLAARMIEKYVKGVQSTGTVATLKHFIANNTDWYRRKSNSILDERTLHEINTVPFKAGIDAGATAVMTSYNLLNGEWCGEDEYTINNLLRKQLGFKWLVMTDWWSVYNGEKLAKSGQDLEMPKTIALENTKQLMEEGKLTEKQLNRMVKSILRTYFAMKLDTRVPDTSYLKTFNLHEQIALQTAREGIVLLKNADNILPIKEAVKNIILTGDYVDKIVTGGGAAAVEGYDQIQMLDELKNVFGDKLDYIKNPTVEELKTADIVLCSIGTEDSEGFDRSFELSEDQEEKVQHCVNTNPNTVVIVTSGSGIKMTDWAPKAKGIIYAWYRGQNGNTALAEIISGKTNPSGKLPMTIEKDFSDSPGYGYLPKGEELYRGWNGEEEKAHAVWDLEYKEGVFVGYRWYEKKNIEPLFPFGYGLSYTTFDYSDIKTSIDTFGENDVVTVTFTLKNTGEVKGMETAQLYISDVEASVARPLKELKGFDKVELNPGESKTVEIKLDKKDFSFWNPATKDWYAEKGKFVVRVGSSSADIKLSKEIELK